MSEKYTIEVRRKTATDDEVLRTHYADTPEEVQVLVESLSESYGQRESVAWDAEMVDGSGKLYGEAPGSVEYLIQVTPSLAVSS